MFITQTGPTFCGVLWANWKGGFFPPLRTIVFDANWRTPGITFGWAPLPPIQIYGKNALAIVKKGISQNGVPRPLPVVFRAVGLVRAILMIEQSKSIEYMMGG